MIYFVSIDAIQHSVGNANRFRSHVASKPAPNSPLRLLAAQFVICTCLQVNSVSSLGVAIKQARSRGVVGRAVQYSPERHGRRFPEVMASRQHVGVEMTSVSRVYIVAQRCHASRNKLTAAQPHAMDNGQPLSRRSTLGMSRKNVYVWGVPHVDGPAPLPDPNPRHRSASESGISRVPGEMLFLRGTQAPRRGGGGDDRRRDTPRPSTLTPVSLSTSRTHRSVSERGVR